MSDPQHDTSDLAVRLVESIRAYRRCVVAYSGGVDSAVVAKAAALALGDDAVAATGVSLSLASGELTAAASLAASIGIRHVVVDTEELTQDAYVQNAPDRCFHCKTELYAKLRSRFPASEGWVLVSGTNADDFADFRPGMQAALDFAVASPLADLGISKRNVRKLAAAWELAVHDKPATPCLSSRVAYGVAVTPERLARIDAAEQLLREHGFARLRVRCHEGELARIEVGAADIIKLASEETRTAVAAGLRKLGFQFVTIDLEGFRSGSFQALVPVETLEQYRANA